MTDQRRQMMKWILDGHWRSKRQPRSWSILYALCYLIVKELTGSRIQIIRTGAETQNEVGKRKPSLCLLEGTRMKISPYVFFGNDLKGRSLFLSRHCKDWPVKAEHQDRCWNLERCWRNVQNAAHFVFDLSDQDWRSPFPVWKLENWLAKAYDQDWQWSTEGHWWKVWMTASFIFDHEC